MIQNEDECQRSLGLQALPSMCSQYTKLSSHRLQAKNLNILPRQNGDSTYEISPFPFYSFALDIFCLLFKGDLAIFFGQGGVNLFSS